VEKAGGKQYLEKIVNKCITGALKGRALKPKSIKMKSLVRYINSVGQAKNQEGKKAPVGC
jgi:hypothetical protein